MPDRFAIRLTNFWDAPWLFKITGDPVATRYMGFKTHETVDDAVAMLRDYDESPSTFLAITPADATHELIGVIAFEVQGHSLSVGIKLNLHDKRARGAGRLVCAPFMRIMLQQPEIWRVWSYCHVDNVLGHRVTERSGAQCEGVLRRYAVFPNVSDEPQDCRLYGMVRT